jgi:hypothetical protein
MSHQANEIVDGFFLIRQDMDTKRVVLQRYGETVKIIQPGKILTLDELHNMLIKERTEMFMEGV